MNSGPLQLKLQRVRWRLRAAALGRRYHVAMLAASVAALALLLTGRLLGVLPERTIVIALGAVLPVAATVALVFHHRPLAAAPAQLADHALGTRDLFLTATLIGSAPGAYRPLVLAAANEQAGRLEPRQIVPFRWMRPAVVQLAAAIVLLAAWRWLPAFDPFGREQHRQELARQREELAAMQRATRERLELLARQPATANRQEIDRLLSDLKATFDAVKPADPAGSQARLDASQKEIGQVWRLMRDDLQRAAVAGKSTPQSLGAGDQARARQWQAELQRGETTRLQQDLAELTKLAQQLAASTDPAAAARLRRELAEKLAAMQEALAAGPNAAELNAALARALEQLQKAGVRDLSAEALKGLVDSLQLTKEELEKLAQAIRDLQGLEDALRAIAAAKQLNAQGKLAPGQGEGAATLAEYAAMYEAMLGTGAGDQGTQPGTGLGPGQGVGPRPYGDEKARTDFTVERSATEFQAGKILMQWRVQGASDAGRAREDYLRTLDDVRRAASEAVLHEEVPPAYHGAIKGYFDSLAAPPAPEGEK